MLLCILQSSGGGFQLDTLMTAMKDLPEEKQAAWGTSIAKVAAAGERACACVCRGRSLDAGGAF